ncbi:hypothetical protein SCP_1100810 [Sparassis crispa]|uniref:cAMP-independent regulatory protein n=1 Tax=Sparassis crispa TaxID=139825 RepID=A0A401GZ15_9APHY|nr:hypothetical protein SCP_1100810 [Sparassis crispa]GBE87405.1 hypothetical protein SCP_1100810 [Sparassis crispa]
MQQPTLQNVHIRSTRDALQIFYSVARNVLPMTTRRLDAEERRAITSGNVYVWEERCANSEATGMGMERWTDGMGWGPSRVRDDFLYYHQRENEINDDPSHPSARWASMMRRRDSRLGGLPYSRLDTERLIKQTYSVHVSLPDDRLRAITRKWHLTAYFSQLTLENLGTIDTVKGVGDVRVPEGWFKSARASKAKRPESHSSDELTPALEPWRLGRQPSTSRTQAASLTDASSLRHMSRPPPDVYPVHQTYHTSPSDHRLPPDIPTPIRKPQTAGDPSTRPRLPTLYDTGLQSYRDPSPCTQSSSSSSSDIVFSPRPYSTPVTPPSTSSLHLPPPQKLMNSDLGPRELVPLNYLQGISGPVRDPLDEAFLRRFSSSNAMKPPPSTPHQSWSGRQTPSVYAGYDTEDRKPNLSLDTKW